jgi:hypothetical protein
MYLFFNFHSSETTEIFAVANELGMTTHEYMWILTRNVIEVNTISHVKYLHFPIGSLGLKYECL